MPKNASERGDGFRFYPWPGGDTPLNRKYDAVEPSDLLSVTSIRTLAGEPFQLVNWKIANVVNLAMGVRKVTRIGPRGGVKEVYVRDSQKNGEFVTRMLEVNGQKALDETRSWLRSTADDPRDIAAVRGSVVHKMIEMGLTREIVDEDVIRKQFALQWAKEKRRVKPEVIDDDINFVANAMEQYWDMRLKVPFIVLAQEPQVYNLKAGYAGSADVLIWFLGTFEEVYAGQDQDGEDVYETVFTPLPEFDVAKVGAAAVESKMRALQKQAQAGTLTLEDVERIGGTVVVGDWKTSKGVYTSHVIQVTAYLAASFVALDGIIDERLTAFLRAATMGLVIHIRPNMWATDLFEFRNDVLRAFLGSLTYARFLAMHKAVFGDLFIHAVSGAADGTEGSEIADESE